MGSEAQAVKSMCLHGFQGKKGMDGGESLSGQLREPEIEPQ